MSEKLDIVGIGNAMVDAIIPSNKQEVEKKNLNRRNSARRHNAYPQALSPNGNVSSLLWTDAASRSGTRALDTRFASHSVSLCNYHRSFTR